VSETAAADSPLDALVDLLCEVDGLSNTDVRDALVDATSVALHRKHALRRTSASRQDLSSMVHTFNALSGGLMTFTGIIAERHPHPSAVRAAELAREIRGQLLLSESDRRDLCRILGGAGTPQMFEALGDLAESPELQHVAIWRDMAAVVRAMERHPAAAGGVPPLLGFVARLAGLLDAGSSAALRRWAANVVGGLGVPESQLDALHMGSRDERSDVPRRGAAGTRQIRGGVPLRNRNFTGRAGLLDRLANTLASGSKAAVLPQAVHGMGGVGKTQLVLEYVYRHLDDYDLVWWVPADAASGVLTSLEQLAGQLGVRPGENAPQTVRLVLDALATGSMKWLLVYDNANDLDSIDEYMPSTGGDVVVTTRNREWASIGRSIEVDVFERHESIDLLRHRTDNSISTADADRLSERLGDLPLALEQAAAWHLLTKMPVSEYIGLLEQHQQELLSEGKPAGYPASVVAFVTLAIEKLRIDSPATAQLLELFAFLGGEPVPVSLLRYGKDADVVQPLRTLLGDPIRINVAVRDLNQYGLVKVDDTQRLQVHRLVQGVLRDALDDTRAREILTSVQELLAEANPGDPDVRTDQSDLHRQREIGPHLDSADMIHAGSIRAKKALLDHVRYLYNIGDYENSRRLARSAAAHWKTLTGEAKLGPTGEYTLQVNGYLANAMRALGEDKAGAELTNTTYALMKEHLGENAAVTLVLANQVGHALRISGAYQESLDFARELLERHRRTFDEFAPYVLRAQSNLAVAHRMVGNFAEAAELDQEVVAYWGSTKGLTPGADGLAAQMNIARDYYGLGAYETGLAVVEASRGPLTNQLSSGHRLVLLAGRTYGIMLRKAGRERAAADVLSSNVEQTLARFGPNHEYSLAAMCSYGNALRQLEAPDEALEYFTEALRIYRKHFGEDHLLTLVAFVNEAAARRVVGELDVASALDALAYDRLIEVLGPDHPYTLCAGSSLATDHAARGDHEAALALSRAVFERSEGVSGGTHEARGNTEHPYHLARAINFAHDLRATGSEEEAAKLRQRSLQELKRALGDTHPEYAAAVRGERLESDIEPPPT
jgi:tetratricopeptide (TPR) repeat protein